jgi:hypothetical protein
VSDDKKPQVAALARILVGMLPQARPVSIDWATKLWEKGVRVHPELDETPRQMPPTQYTVEDQQTAVDGAWRTLREMAREYPQFASLVAGMEAAQTSEERAALAMEVRAKIEPEIFEAAQQRAAQLAQRDDHTQ